VRFVSLVGLSASTARFAAMIRGSPPTLHGNDAIERMAPRHSFVGRPRGRAGLGYEVAVWAQIAVAFEVRNVIEHRDGKVDAKFRKTVREDWPKSTWGRVSVTEVKKVTVEYDDVIAAFDAMLRATDLLTRSLVDWCSAVNE